MNEFLFILVFCLLWKESSSRPGVESFAIPYKLVWTFSDVCRTLAVLTFLLVWTLSDVYQRQVMLTFFLVWTFSDVRQTLSSLGCGNVWIANSGFSLYWFVWQPPLSVGTSRMPACNTSHIICHVLRTNCHVTCTMSIPRAREKLVRPHTFSIIFLGI